MSNRSFLFSPAIEQIRISHKNIIFYSGIQMKSNIAWLTRFKINYKAENKNGDISYVALAFLQLDGLYYVQFYHSH